MAQALRDEDFDSVVQKILMFPILHALHRLGHLPLEIALLLPGKQDVLKHFLGQDFEQRHEALHVHLQLLLAHFIDLNQLLHNFLPMLLLFAQFPSGSFLRIVQLRPELFIFVCIAIVGAFFLPQEIVLVDSVQELEIEQLYLGGFVNSSKGDLKRAEVDRALGSDIFEIFDQFFDLGRVLLGLFLKFEQCDSVLEEGLHILKSKEFGKVDIDKHLLRLRLKFAHGVLDDGALLH